MESVLACEVFEETRDEIFEETQTCDREEMHTGMQVLPGSSS